MLLKSRTWAMGFSGSILSGDPKGAQPPAAPKEVKKPQVCSTMHLPAMMLPNMSVHQRSQGELLHALHSTIPQPVCVCAQPVHGTCSGGNQDESQPDLETE